MSKSPYRNHSRAVIEKVIQDNPDADVKELRKLVSKAYPFDRRRGWAYDMWLKEVKAHGLSRDGKGPSPQQKLVPDDIVNFWLKKKEADE